MFSPVYLSVFMCVVVTRGMSHTVLCVFVYVCCGGTREWSIPGAFGGPWVLPRLEDRGQPPFLHQLEAGNVGRSHERGAASPPSGPMLDFRGCTHSRPRSHTDCARLRRRRHDSLPFALFRYTFANINPQTL